MRGLSIHSVPLFPFHINPSEAFTKSAGGKSRDTVIVKMASPVAGATVEEIVREAAGDDTDFRDAAECMAEINYQTTGDTVFMDGAIQVAMLSVREPLAPAVLAARARTLGTMLQERFKRTGNAEDLGEAIDLYRRAVASTPDDHPDRAELLMALGSTLTNRFELDGDIKDLEEAIVMTQRSVEATPQGSDQIARMSVLANKLNLLYQRKGGIEDLEEAISIPQRLVDLATADDPNRATFLNNLGNRLERRYIALGKSQDLEDAIQSLQQAVDLLADDDPGRVVCLSKLGAMLIRRYEQTQRVEDLDDGSQALRQVLDITPESHPNRWGYLNNLGVALQARFERTRAVLYLDEAVEVTQTAFQLAPENHPSRPSLLNHLGTLLVHRYDTTDEVRYLDEAIRIVQKAVDLTPEDQPQRVRFLSSLGTSLLGRYTAHGDTEMLDAAIQVAQRAVTSSCPSQLDRVAALRNAGDMLETRYKRAREMHDLDESIQMAQQAVDAGPLEHPDRPAMLRTLQDRLEIKSSAQPVPIVPTYNYSPLDSSKREIRLIKVQPTCPGGVVECSLYHVSLDDNPFYAALSYVWGDANENRTIMLDDVPFMVTRNLEIALRRMRSRHVEEPLWVDAVCINQGDLQEKNHQIQIMRPIYQQAFAVFAWLGEADDDTHLAMQLIDAVGSDILGIDTTSDESATRADSQAVAQDEKDDLESDSWMAVMKLMDRPYWSRGWIVQELAVAKSSSIFLGCGKYWTPWQFLAVAVVERGTLARKKQLSAVLTEQDGGYVPTATMIADYHLHGPLGLGKLLRLSREHDTTVPHDRLYAFLGIMNEQARSAFPPDYSIPIGKLSAELVKYIIEAECNLDALHVYRTEEHQSPSWVPQLSGFSPDKSPWHQMDTKYSASNTTKPIVRFSADLKTITLRGFLVDTVASCDGPFESSQQLWTKFLCTREFQDMAANAMMPHGRFDNPEDIEEAIWRTLIADRPLDVESSEYGSFREMYQLLSSRSLKLVGMDKGDIDMTELTELLAEDVLPYVISIATTLGGRCFATTRGGRIATAPSTVRPGDLLCVMYGGSIVHVLREEEDHYLLVGEAYVHGLMDGEVVKAYQDGGSEYQERDFTIW